MGPESLPDFFLLYFYIKDRARRKVSRSKGSSRLWMSVGAMVLGAVSALYDKYLLRHYLPLEVQAWYSLYQLLLMAVIVALLFRFDSRAGAVKFTWRWTIPCITLFLTVADVAYFYSLSQEGAMISIVSMVRRRSVLVPFIYGVVALPEKNVKEKSLDSGLLLLTLGLLVAGSRM